MIVHPAPDVLRVLFTLKGSIVKRIALRCLMITLLAALIVLVERHFPAFFYPVSATPFTLLGLSLSIFMSFRNNACYDRWWEGRKAWGKLIIETRSFVRESQVIADPALRAELLRNLCGFAHALNAHLRNEDELAAARPWLARPEALGNHNVCDAILREVGGHCSRLAEQQHISDWRYSLLEQRLVGLTEGRPPASGSRARPCRSPTRCCCTAPSTSSACCCRLPWPNHWAGWRHCSPPSWGTPFSGWMRLATSWKTRSGAMKTTCRPMPWCAPWSAMYWPDWANNSCRRHCCRWGMC